MSPEGSPTKPELARSLKSRHVTMISIAGIIGAGLFVGSSAAIGIAGPAVVVSYVIAGLIMLCVMRMLTEMASTHTRVSIFTDYVRRGVGPWGGFVCGWLYWYFWVVVVAIEVIAGSAILANWMPVPRWIISISLMSVMTAINLLSTRTYGEFEFWFATVKIIAILCFIGTGLAALFGVLPAPGAGLANLTAHGGFMPHGISSVMVGVVAVIFAMTGAEIATIAAAESDESALAVSRLAISLVLRILFFYVGSVLLIVLIVPWSDIQVGVSPFAQALEHLKIPGAAVLMNAVVLTAVLSCLNSGIYISSRVLFSLAGHGDAPQSLVKLSPHRRVPVAAILLGSSLGFAAIFTQGGQAARVFAFLVNASGALTFFVYLLIAVAQLRLRAQLDRDAPGSFAVKMWGFPWLTRLVIAAIVAMLAAMALDPARAPELYASLASLAVVVLCAAIRFRR